MPGRATSASTVFDAARSPKTSELVAAEIRARIIRGELNEGDTLPLEAELCKSFQVSRPTLREAFRILESERLISVRRGDRTGAVVHEPDIRVTARYVGLLLQHRGASIEDVDVAFEIILPAAAKRLAVRHTKADVAALRAHVAKMSEVSPDLSGVLELLTEFNYLLLELTGNITIALLGRLLSNIVDLHISAMAEQWRSDPPFSETFATAAVRGCQRLVDLIETGDAQGAEAFWAKQMEKADRRAAQMDGVLNLLR